MGIGLGLGEEGEGNEKSRGGGSFSLPFCRFLFSDGSDESVSFRSSIESDGST